ncbi:WD40 repeat domain-containing serine/threonine protein kinase [Stieleria varia]|nr:WD40 repeat domain-containing serine/threonine protein kinase [Stieleria varia]
MDQAARIRQLLDQYREALRQDSDYDLSAVYQSHPDLMPELKRMFEALRSDILFSLSERTRTFHPDSSATETLDLESTETTSDPQRLSVRYVGEYRLDSILGEGSFGQVWRGMQLSLSRPVAVKLLKREHQHPDLVARFRREAMLLARLQHPNIVSVLEVNECDGVHYIAMEFVEGTDLKHVIQQGLPTPHWSARAMATAAQAVAHAHEADLIHRDLKPANILVDTNSQLKLTDFGLARQTTGGTELTKTGAIVGTISYMAPEQASGRADQLGPAVDIYAIGATLYHLLTGRPPFPSRDGLHDLAVLDEIRERNPVPPRRLCPDRNIPRDLETICLKCLEKEPRLRYESAAALAADLTRFLDGDPILARPTSLWERTWRRAKKRPMAAALVATLLLVSLVGGATVWTLSLKTTRLTNEVESVRQEKSFAEQEKSLAEQEKSRAEQERNTAAATAVAKEQEAEAANQQKAWQEYTTDMQLVGTAWQAGKMEVVRDLLNKHRPENDPGATDLRGPEWHYWDFRVHNTSQLIPAAHGRSAAVSSDGRRLAMADETHATIWDLQTLQPLQRWRISPGRPTNFADSSDHHGEFDHSVAFSPSGRLCAATNFRIMRDRRVGSVRVWDVETGEERLAITGDRFIGGRAVCFSPDERLVLAGGYGYAYKAWDLETRQEVIPKLRSSDPTNPSFVKVGTPWSGEVVVWDMAFWRNILMLRCDLLGPSFPDWPHPEKQVTPWIHSEIPLRLRGPTRQHRTVYGYDGVELYAAVRNDDDTLDLHQMANPRVNGIEVKRLEGGPVSCVTIRDQALVAAGRDRVIRIWETHLMRSPRELRGSEQEITGMALSPDHNVLITFPPTRVWRLDQQSEFALPLPPVAPHLINRIDSHGKQYCVTHQSRNVKLIDDTQGRVIADIPCEQFVGAWFSPDDRRVAVTLSDKKRFTTQLWDLVTEQRIAELPIFGRAGNPHAFSGGAFSSDGRWLAGHGCLWDAETGKQVLNCGDQLTPAVAFSPSNQRVAFVGARETCVWDLVNKRQIAKLPCGGNGVVFQEDETQLILAGQSISVWDISTAREIPTTFGSGAADSIALSPDGRRIYALKPGEVRIFSNRDWNHLLTLRCATPRTAAELEALFDEVARKPQVAKR